MPTRRAAIASGGLLLARFPFGRLPCTVGSGALVTAADFVSAQTAEQARLQLETGSHSAPVRRIAVSADRSLIATACDDKTARIWRREDRQLLMTLRPPIGDGAAGRLYGVAFHPQLPLVAVAGTAAAAGRVRIHIFRSLSGEAVQLLEGGAGEVKRLAWTADGRWLVAATAAPGGVRVFGEGREVSAVPLDGDAYGLDIDSTGRIAVTETAGSMRLLRLDPSGQLEPLAKLASPGTTPVAVAFSPDGQRIALAHFAPDRNASVDLIASDDARVLATLRAPSVGPGRTQSVVWEGAGRLRVGGVRRREQGSPHELIDSVRGYVQSFDVATSRPLALLDVGSDTVTDLARDGDGVAFANADGSWGTVDATDTVHRLAPSTDFVRRADRLLVAADGSGVQWQTRSDASSRSFRLRERVVRPTPLLNALAPVRPGPLSGTRDWESASTATTTLFGTQIRLGAGEVSRAVARIPGSEDVAWGTGQRLARVAPGGRVLWSWAQSTEVRAVNASEDGRLIVTAMSDATIRWFRAEDGVPLLALYATSSAEWVLWTPAGHYDASPGAEHLIGWTVNSADGRNADFFSIGRFRQRLHRPDLIDRLLADGDEARALDFAERNRAEALAALSIGEAAPPTGAKAADTAEMPAAHAPVAAPRAPLPAATAPASVSAPVASAPAAASGASRIDAAPQRPLPIALASTEILRGLPPTLLYKQPRVLSVPGDTATLEFGVVLRPGDALTSLIVRRDGALQELRDQRLPRTFDGLSSGTLTVDVPVGESTVHVVAANAWGSSDALTFILRREAPPRLQAPPPGRLFVLAVGVSKFSDGRVNPLNLPAKDATDFAAALRAQAGRAYASVEARVLTDGSATRTAIYEGLRWLSSSVSQRDVGMLFLAGHAVNHPNGSYYFISHDVAADRIATTAVDEGAIRAALVRLRGRAVFFVDTCHAGNVIGRAKGFSRDLSKIANDLASPENGVIVFASSTGRQESLENLDWGNGAFTKALLAGIRGSADLLRRGRVTFQGLGYYVSAEVEKLTNGEQTPVLISPPPGLPDFTLALVEQRTGSSTQLGVWPPPRLG